MNNGANVQRFGLCVILAAALFAAPSAFAQEVNDDDITGAATDAYTAMTLADEARDNEDWAGAISGYRDALGLYRQLAVSQPDWEPDTVRYRIAYCSSQIEMIGRETGQSASELVTNSAPAASTEEEGQELQGSPAVSTEASDGAPTNDAEARVSQLEQERATLAAEVETLKQQIEKSVTEAPVAPVFVLPANADDVLQKMHDGLARERSGDYGGAQGVYEQILASRPAYAEARKAKGRCLVQQGRLDEAIAVFSAVAFANRDDAQARVLLGTTYCMAGKYQPAVEVLTPLVVIDPSNARAQNALGAAWMGLGDTRSAQIALEKAVSLDPQLADAHFNLAQVLFAADPANANKARQHYLDAMALGAGADEELAKTLGSP